MEQAKNKQRVGALDMSNNTAQFLDPKKVKPESDVEYLVIDENQCFYTAFFNPLCYNGWMDVSNNRELNVVAYQELPNTDDALLAVYKTKKAISKVLNNY